MIIFIQGFTVYSSGCALGYVNGNLCNFCPRILCCVLFPRCTERFVAYGFLYGSKILRVDAGSGFVHRDKFSPRVPVCSFISQVSLYILLYFSTYFYIVGNLRAFICLRVLQIFIGC